jgi:hypothetical protein
MSNPFQECLDEIADAGHEWERSRRWLKIQADKFDAKPMFTNSQNPASATLELSRHALAGLGEVRRQLLILVHQFDAKGREDASHTIPAYC